MILVLDPANSCTFNISKDSKFVCNLPSLHFNSTINPGEYTSDGADNEWCQRRNIVRETWALPSDSSPASAGRAAVYSRSCTPSRCAQSTVVLWSCRWFPVHQDTWRRDLTHSTARHHYTARHPTLQLIHNGSSSLHLMSVRILSTGITSNSTQRQNVAIYRLTYKELSRLLVGKHQHLFMTTSKICHCWQTTWHDTCLNC